MPAQIGMQTRVVVGLLLGCIVSFPIAAQAKDRMEILRVVQSAASAAAFDTAKAWLSGENGTKMEWWLRGNEAKFASCTGETFVQRLAEWQKDALWLSQDVMPSWYGEANQEAQKHCIDLLVKANITRCSKTAGQVTCKAPQL